MQTNIIWLTLKLRQNKKREKTARSDIKTKRKETWRKRT